MLVVAGAGVIWSPRRVGRGGHAEQIEDLKLQFAQGWLEDLHDSAITDEVVALEIVEDLEDPRCGGGRTVAQLGVEGDAIQSFGAHGVADLALDERLGELGEEVAGEKGLDAMRRLQEHGATSWGPFSTWWRRSRLGW